MARLAPARSAGPLAALLCGVALVLAACGGSSGPSSTATSSTEPASGAGATTDVQQAYATLFDLASPAIAPKLAVVQDGAALQATITHELTSPLAKLAAGASVTDVAVQPTSTCSSELLPSPCAALEYAILSPAHKPLLAASKGFAVYVSGKWLVAKITICSLLSIASGGTAPAGC
jgi:hypothetical protein